MDLEDGGQLAAIVAAITALAAMGVAIWQALIAKGALKTAQKQADLAAKSADTSRDQAEQARRAADIADRSAKAQALPNLLALKQAITATRRLCSEGAYEQGKPDCRPASVVREELRTQLTLIDTIPHSVNWLFDEQLLAFSDNGKRLEPVIGTVIEYAKPYFGPKQSTAAIVIEMIAQTKTLENALDGVIDKIKRSTALA